MPHAGRSLTIDDARRIALGAQGFDASRPGAVTRDHLAGVIRTMGLLQLDFVNAICPSHYLVPFSRVGPYSRRLLDDVVYRSAEFTEQWAHEASVVPMDVWPLLRYRMETHRARPWGFDEIMRTHHVYVDTVMTEIRARGPLCAADLPDPTHTGRRIPGSWYGNVPRAVLEACFGRGRLAVTERKSNFARVFDLAERVIPRGHYARRVAVHDAERELLRRASQALGVATVADLADYFRMKVRDAEPRVRELVESGDLEPAAVDGWKPPAYLAKGATAVPVRAAALVSPFDPVVWFRPRTARLFAFDYRFEVFTPEARRRWGTYVLPFLLGNRLVARVDLKADRAGRRLQVRGAFLEEGADSGEVTTALGAELRTMAAWLGLESVAVGRRGNLARALRAALSRSA